MLRKSKRSPLFVGVGYLALLSLLIFTTSCIYMKMDPPPDVNKSPFPPAAGDNSCWMATAANMLAGAGYGTGNTVQARSQEIYGEMVAQYANPNGTIPGGWTDTALSWWLSSANNTWPNNPYTVVTVYGNKSPKNPWANANGAQFIGNELRRCQFLGLSISWPTAGASIGSGGHAITAWGDNAGGSGVLSTNPFNIRLTDSDRAVAGNVHNYTYDTYANPNPGGANEGNGWYFNYDNNHPYIKHIITLCPTDNPGDKTLTQKVVGSYKIHQSDDTRRATDLHYKVGTDADILTYKTSIDWGTNNSPSITENGPPRRELTVDWNLSDKPVPYCTWITITTEFVLPYWNAIKYKDVHFTYPEKDARIKIPEIGWRLETPKVKKAASIVNVTGGYVVGTFDIIDPNATVEQGRVGEYRFIHQYSFNQSPENHVFTLEGSPGYQVSNVRFGHSYGMLDTTSLWRFNAWMTKLPEKRYELGEKPIKISIDWKGRLPYPEGEDIRGRIPEKQTRKK